MDRSFFALWITVSALTLGLSPSDAWAQSKGPISIGICAVKSGPSKDLGLSYVGGAIAYLQHVNDNGGIGGRKIDPIWIDDQYEPNNAVNCVNELLKQNVLAFGFSVGSPTGAKYTQMALSQKLPFIGLSAGPAFMYDPENRYVFAGRASYADEAREEVDHLWNDLGVRRIGVIYQADAFGASGLSGIKSALAKYGADIAVQGSYPRNTVEVAQAYKQVKDAGPEAVILIAVHAPAAEVLKLAKADGWGAPFVTIAGRDNLLIKAAGDAAEGVIIANPVPPADQTHLATIKLHEKTLKKYSPDATAGAISVQGFVEAMILVEGLKRAGKDLTRESLIEGLEKINDLDVGLGPDYKVTYGPKDHQAFSKFYFSVIKGGKAQVFKDWKTLKK
jgi:branched-chain amino acid transport system substrate-binding protein